MRYPASEKLEIIKLVEGSHLSARQTLSKLGLPRTTFYRWYDRYLKRGEAGLHDQAPKPAHVWNRIPDKIRRKIVALAFKETELSPRELAVMFTDTEKYFVSESSVFQGLMPPLDLALSLWMIRRATRMLHAFVLQPFSQIA